MVVAYQERMEREGGDLFERDRAKEIWGQGRIPCSDQQLLPPAHKLAQKFITKA
jgi:hypothetical protein